ncbi:MAG: hypothetical protein Q8P11_04350, partial [bacterium]|nr:hypothetical protein [bacterium]
MGVFLFIQSKNDATMAAGPTITVLDISLGAGTGPYNSTAVASDTFSRVSYYDSGYTALGFVQCTNITCSTSTITTVDNTADVGQYTSLVLGSDGFARISYYDATNDDLKFVRCADAACTDIPARVITTIDSTGDVGQYTSLSLDPDTDFARISYYDVTNSALKFVQCTDITCSTSTITTVDNTGDVGQYTSIDLDFDDFARISYYDVTNGNLKFVQCKSDDCVGVENADPLLDTRPAVQTLDS